MYGQIEKNCKKHYTIGSFLAKDDWVQAQKRKLIVGLLAHVDAGKTTLSEGMLFQSGEIRKLGRVDHRDAFLDTDIQERERGITIFSKQARLQWKDADITLLDTPGHVDFTSEMERALQVMDCAVLLISGADGVQGHTLTLWRLLKRYQVPVFLFVNKMDQPDTDKEKLLKQLQEELSPDCMDFAAEDLMDTLAMCSESMLSQFLSNGEISDGLIAAQVMQRNIFPCFFAASPNLCCDNMHNHHNYTSVILFSILYHGTR